MKRRFTSLLVILALILPVFSVNVVLADDTLSEEQRLEKYKDYVNNEFVDRLMRIYTKEEANYYTRYTYKYYYIDFTDDGQKELLILGMPSYGESLLDIKDGKVRWSWGTDNLVKYQGKFYALSERDYDTSIKTGNILLDELVVEDIGDILRMDTKPVGPECTQVNIYTGKERPELEYRSYFLINAHMSLADGLEGTKKEYYVDGEEATKAEYEAYYRQLCDGMEDIRPMGMSYDEFMGLSSTEEEEETEGGTTPIEFYKLVHYYDSGWTYLFKMRNLTNEVSKGTYIVIPYHSSEKDGTFPYGYTEINYEIKPYTTEYGQISFDHSFVLSSFGYHDYVAAQKPTGKDDYMLILKLDDTDNVEDIKKELEENDIHTGWFDDIKDINYNSLDWIDEVHTEKAKAWLAQYVK